MNYTTVEAIADRLNFILEVTPPTFGSNLGAKQVNPALLQRVGEQVEAKLNAALRQVYQPVPIPSMYSEAHLILAPIVEKHVCSEILIAHFVPATGPQLSGDGGLRSVLRKEAQEETAALFVTHGIYIPGLMPEPGTYLPGKTIQPIVLPGVPLKLERDQPDTLTRNYSYVAQRGAPTRDARTDKEIDWGV